MSQTKIGNKNAYIFYSGPIDKMSWKNHKVFLRNPKQIPVYLHGNK